MGESIKKIPCWKYCYRQIQRLLRVYIVGIKEIKKNNPHFLTYSFFLCYHDHVGDREHWTWGFFGLVFQLLTCFFSLLCTGVQQWTYRLFTKLLGRGKKRDRMYKPLSSATGSNTFKQREAIFSFLSSCLGFFLSSSSFSIPYAPYVVSYLIHVSSYPVSPL